MCCVNSVSSPSSLMEMLNSPLAKTDPWESLLDTSSQLCIESEHDNQPVIRPAYRVFTSFRFPQLINENAMGDGGKSLKTIANGSEITLANCLSTHLTLPAESFSKQSLNCPAITVGCLTPPLSLLPAALGIWWLPLFIKIKEDINYFRLLRITTGSPSIRA